jgi:hypothetical protein
VDRMRRYHKMEKQPAEIEYMFDRMHGHPRPGCRIGDDNPLTSLSSSTILRRSSPGEA